MLTRDGRAEPLGIMRPPGLSIEGLVRQADVGSVEAWDARHNMQAHEW